MQPDFIYEVPVPSNPFIYDILDEGFDDDDWDVEDPIFYDYDEEDDDMFVPDEWENIDE